MQCDDSLLAPDKNAMMQVFIRTISGETLTTNTSSDATIRSIRDRLFKRTGLSSGEQRLTFRGKSLHDDRSVAEYGIGEHDQLELIPRLRGGGEPLDLTIKPRVQKETWSLYWKESMHTDTECLDAFELTADPATTISDLQIIVADKLDWLPIDKLLRLEGFKENWQRCLKNGRELPEDRTLQECGITTEAKLTVIRKELIAEGAIHRLTHREYRFCLGWSIHVDDDDISTSDESDL